MPFEAVIPVSPRFRPWWRERPVRFRVAWGGVAALAGGAAALGASAHGMDAVDNGLLRGAFVGAPLGAGVYAFQARLHPAFARLLVIAGLTAFASTFAESPVPALYTLGRAAGWGLELVVVVMLLSFPMGELTTVADRRLTKALAIALAAFMVPTLLFASALLVPSPYTSCVADCPPSALRIDALASATAGRLLSGLGVLAIFAVSLGVAVRLQQRIRLADRVEASILAPVLAIAMARTAVLGVGILSHELTPDDGVAAACARFVAWCIPLIAVAFLVGLLRLRLQAARTLQQLVAGAQCASDVAALQRAFGEALHDPTLELRVLPRDAGAAPSSADRAVCQLGGSDGTTVTVRSRGVPLAGRADLLDAACRLAAAGLERQRLTSAAEQSAREIARSRARIAATAERERRRIERDLHDGAQQRLVALRIELALVEDLLAGGDLEASTARLHELEGSVDAALEELRALAHGVCPPLLADRGLREALRAGTSRCVVPTRLIADGVGRYSPEVESAVYFCILEALQNVAKHARGARRAIVWVRDDGRGQLAFSVRDDGAGVRSGDDGEGAGLVNMRDRLAGVDGSFELSLVRGRGGEARGTVPVAVRRGDDP